ncbi:MAG: DUF721 domain-containing protein [Candidatus Magasanikbacteria bacterium]|nr:DUF721 domain-containing protein [Candidatus Magasanikbacteria bacterium]
MMEPLARLLRQFSATTHREQITAELVLAASRASLLIVAGGALQSTVVPRYFRQGTLALSCASAAAAQETRLQATKLMAAINRRLGQNLVRRLTYQTALPNQ